MLWMGCYRFVVLLHQHSSPDKDRELYTHFTAVTNTRRTGSYTYKVVSLICLLSSPVSPSPSPGSFGVAIRDFISKANFKNVILTSFCFLAHGEESSECRISLSDDFEHSHAR